MLRLIGADATGARDGAALDAAAVPVDSAQYCSLLELAQGKCRWPVSDHAGAPGAADFMFSGNEAVEGFSYCAGHARLAYRTPERRRA